MINIALVVGVNTCIVILVITQKVGFRVKRISEIMDEAEYPGIRVSMETEFDLSLIHI